MSRLPENEYYLEPEYDSRQSFYRKAIVRTKGTISELISYSTHVATIDMSKEGNERCEIHGFYSPTTTRHIKDFIYQAGLKVGSTNELWEMYTVEGRKALAEKARKAEEREARKIEKERLQVEKEERKLARLEARKEKLRKSFTKEFGDTFSKDEIESFVLNEING